MNDKPAVEIELRPRLEPFQRYFELTKKLSETVKEARSLLDELASFDGLVFEVTEQSDRLSQNHYHIQDND